MTRPVWVSIEGIDRIARNLLAQRVATHLGAEAARIQDLPNRPHGSRRPSLGVDALAALVDSSQLRQRTDHVAAETLTMLALNVRAYEQFDETTNVRILIEDPGIDFVAVHQAIRLAGQDGTVAETAELMTQIYDTAAYWRPLPDLTILLRDISGRVGGIGSSGANRRDHAPQQDDGGPQQPAADRVGQLYALQVQRDPRRFYLVDGVAHRSTQHAEEAVVACVRQLCLTRIPRTPGPGPI